MVSRTDAEVFFSDGTTPESLAAMQYMRQLCCHNKPAKIGRREGEQEQFFYSFHLDKVVEVVPASHLVRQIEGLLDPD